MRRISNINTISLLLFLSVLYTIAHCQEDHQQNQQYTHDQCLSFGFVPEKLACGVCREMSTFISETSLITQCNACCNPSLDSEKVSQLYSHTRIFSLFTIHPSFSHSYFIHFTKKEIQESYIRNLSIETFKLSRGEELY